MRDHVSPHFLNVHSIDTFGFDPIHFYALMYEISINFMHAAHWFHLIEFIEPHGSMKFHAPKHMEK